MERSYIYLFVLFVIFYAIRYGDTVEQTTCTFSRPMIWANCAPLNVWGSGDYYIGANQAGKRARSLFNCISVTDGIKINEQNKSIGIGPLYLHTEFEAISLLLQKVMAGLNPVGYRTLQYWQGASARSQKVFYHREMVWYEVLKIGC